MAVIAIVASAGFLLRSEKQLSDLAAHRRAFDRQAREALASLSDLRASQQAYVSIGQGLAFWSSKVSQTQDLLNRTLASLRESATSGAARSALDEVQATLTQFAEVDKRARDYLKAEQQLMAGDVVFTEGVETAAMAALQLETARDAEAQALDASEAAIRGLQAKGLGVTAGLVTLMLLLLAFSSATPSSAASASTSPASVIARPANDAASFQGADNLSLHEVSAIAPPSRPVSPVLKTAAQLCTDFARVRDLDGLTALVSRAADTMDAAGAVVWMGNAEGADLQPVMTHGYPERVRARLPNVPRSANNAAAAAYRTGSIQIVAPRRGADGSSGGRASGAIVAPIMSPDGCVGAFSAEIRNGGEASESVQALATIFAAQLAAVLTPTSSESETKTAAQL